MDIVAGEYGQGWERWPAVAHPPDRRDGRARGLRHARHLALLDAGTIVAVCDILPEAAYLPRRPHIWRYVGYDEPN